MGNINSYIKKFGNKSFFEVPFNEIDNLILCSLSYLDFQDIVPGNRKFITLNEAGNKFLRIHSIDEYCKYCIPEKDAHIILSEIVDTKRYGNLLLYNYVYINDDETQFGALAIKSTGHFTYISFEGTDHLVSGWKEDFTMGFTKLIPSQILAIEYLNNVVKWYDKNVIVGGHSKGGNLAVISSLYAKKFVKKKIKKIYNNDGPGLKLSQLEDINYQKIKDKYIHIIPNYSYVGILLRSEKYKIVKTSKMNMASHSMMTWQITNKRLVECSLSKVSKSLQKTILQWLNSHTYDEREKMVAPVFNLLENSGISSKCDLSDVKKIIKVITGVKNVDQETKDLLINFLKLNINGLFEKNID